MNNMNGMEKRRFKRMKVEMELTVSSLFKQDHISIDHINSAIEVVDISKSGIGFEAEAILPIGYYFNAGIKLGEEEDILYCVVKIIRCQPIPDSDMFSYGAEFVGMPNILNYIFDEYAAEHAE